MRALACLSCLLLASACGARGGGDGDDDAPAVDAGPGEACSGGARPALEACVSGDFFSDCGGEGDAVFACKEVGPVGLQDCRWFVSGCAADGYVVSGCPADDVCCLGDWPYPTAGAPSEVAFRFLSFGTAPWDRARAMAVDVVVDASLAPRPLTLACSGADPVGGAATPCNGFYGGPFALRFDTLVVQFPSDAGSGWFAWIEVDLEAPRARVCALPFASTLPESCPRPDRLRCATTGTVTLDRLPASEAELAGLTGTLDVQFEGGFRLTGGFTY